MSREVRRVPENFDWPLRKVWEGYFTPERLQEKQCPDCEYGYSPRAEYLRNLWYGNAPFRPEDNGSVPLTIETPAVRAFAERNIFASPGYHGELAIRREAARLAHFWNGLWSHHLNDEDVAALVAGGRLYDFTHTFVRGEGWKPKDPLVAPSAAEVNNWAIQSFGHDGINCHVVIQARCEREGQPFICATCEGSASIEAYPGQRAEAEKWAEEDHGPPTGEGWQLWETTSEGSPVGPVFATAEELAQWLLTDDGAYAVGFGHSRAELTIEQARKFVGVGWAPSAVGDSAGIHGGAEWIAKESE